MTDDAIHDDIIHLNPTAPHGLLQPCVVSVDVVETVDGWQFIRPLAHDLVGGVSVGTYLFERPAPGPMDTISNAPWSIQHPGEDPFGVPRNVAETFLAEDRIDRVPQYRHARDAVHDECVSCSFVETELPEVGLELGDVLTLASGPVRGRGRACALSRNEYEVVREAVLSDGEAFLTDLFPLWDAGGWTTVASFLRDRRRWGRNNATCRLYRIRPSRVSEPIVASCDDVAIFDVISDAGCKMPGGEATPQDPAA